MEKLTQGLDEKLDEPFKHVDDFIDYGSMKGEGNPKNEKYARWVLNHFRLSAICKNDFDEFMKDHKLFCQFRGKQYRVTGASRLGDVWLTKDFNQSVGYQDRVYVNECYGWRKTTNQ